MSNILFFPGNSSDENQRSDPDMQIDNDQNGDAPIKSILARQRALAHEGCRYYRPENESEHLGESELLTGTSFRINGDFVRSERAYLRALGSLQEKYGVTHVRVAEALNHLVGLYNTEKNYKMAEMLARRSLAIYESVLGFDHEVTCAVSLAVALLCQKLDNVAEATIFYRNSYPRKSTSSEETTIIAGGLLSLARECYKDEKFQDAEFFLRHAALEHNNEKWPANPRLGYALTSLANACSDRGAFEESAVLYGRALDLFRTSLGPAHGATAYVDGQYRLVLSYLFQRQPLVTDCSKDSVKLVLRDKKARLLKALNERAAQGSSKGLSSRLGSRKAMLRASLRLVSSTEKP
jgi:tetratricopeptide (TPR) repeat protein